MILLVIHSILSPPAAFQPLWQLDYSNLQSPVGPLYTSVTIMYFLAGG